MGAALITCPGCGAGATRAPSDELLQCEYCGQVSLIMRRTGFFERAQEPAKRSESEFRDLPIAKQPRSKSWWLKAAIPFIAPGLIVVAVVYLASASKWHGKGVPLFVDVNGDGVADVVGRTESGFGPKVRVSAVDGSSGDILWESAPLALRPENGLTGTLLLHGDTVVFAHDNVGNWQGPTLAWRLRTGRLLWRARGIEGRHARVCRRNDGVLFPHSRAVLHLRDGRVSQAPPKLTCEPLAYDKARPPVTFDQDAREGIEPIGPIDPYLAVRRRGSTGPWALIGTQSKGPDAHYVAMSASGDGRFTRQSKLAWTTEVQRERGIQWQALTGAVSGDAVFSTYWHAPDKTTYVVANRREGGDVLWKSDIGKVTVSAIGYASKRVVVVGHHLLKILDASTGKVLVDFGPL